MYTAPETMTTRTPSQPLRRSLLFVPGGEPRKLEKARDASADTLVLDLEDSVPPAEKNRARELIAASLRRRDFTSTEIAVRVNPPGTPYFDEDLHAAVASGVDAIMLPKAEGADALRGVAERLGALERECGFPDGRVRLLALVETAAGIATAALLPGASTRVDALCFGHVDFARDMGVAATDPGQGIVLHARCALAIAARAGGIAPIDTVFVDVRDDAGFRRDAELGRSLGFDGKLCIHPGQVPLANEVHTPTQAQIDYAQRVLAAFEQARAEGKGVLTVDGEMVDAPVVMQQERILDRARRAGLVTAADASHG